MRSLPSNGALLQRRCNAGACGVVRRATAAVVVHRRQQQQRQQLAYSRRRRRSAAVPAAAVLMPDGTTSDNPTGATGSSGSGSSIGGTPLASSSLDGSLDNVPYPAVTVSVTAPLPAAPPPEPLAVMHSDAFLRAKRRAPTADAAAPPQPTSSAIAPSSSSSSNNNKNTAAAGRSADNALAWALAKVDAQLDEIEANPPLPLPPSSPVASGPVGAAAGRGVQAAAKITVDAAGKAVRAAAPVGGWALREGAKAAGRAAVGLVAFAMEQRRARAEAEKREAEEQRRRQKQQQQQQGRNKR